MKMIKRVLYNQWFDIIVMSILLMWIAPWGSFNIKSVELYFCIIVSILSIKTTRYFLKKYQKGLHGKE
jgi:hypothetical protein